jgi:hypothetical protein
MEPETIVKFFLSMSVALGVPITLYVGYRYAMMWLRRYEQEGEMLAGQPGETQARLEVLESHVAELQERVDFAERLLAQEREPDRLHG